MINTYANLGGNSSVLAYEILPTSIRVQFKGGKWYSYSFSKAGHTHVDNMKELAENGVGLCSYIQRNAKYLYVNLLSPKMGRISMLPSFLL